MDNYVIRREMDQVDREAALRLRHLVFVEEQQIPVHQDADGKDEQSIHVLAFTGDQAVATARITVDRSDVAVISRVAVLPQHRGAGLGQRMVENLEVIARDNSKAHVELEPHHYLERFYSRLGYQRVEGSSLAGEHQLIVMRKAL